MKRLIGLMVILISIVVSTQAIERKKYNFNSDWRLKVGDVEGARAKEYNTDDWKRVTLPYAWNQNEAFAVGCDSLSTGVAWYRKNFILAPEMLDNTKLFLEFEGARMLADVFVNGKKMWQKRERRHGFRY